MSQDGESQTGELLGLTGPTKGEAEYEEDCGTPAGKIGLNPDLTITGTVDLKNHTAKGRIACAQGGWDGDWSAGE